MSEEAPASAEEIEETIDTEGVSAEPVLADPFENIETGVLERDVALHQPALVEETPDGEVLDLGRVEGLSAAPSTLRQLVEDRENGEERESDTIKNAD